MKEMMKFLADEAAGKQSVQDALNGLPRADSNAAMGNAINVLLYAAGVVAVVMIIISGMRMTTSAGNPSAVAKAKQTLIYAIVGLLITVLAYAIVNFVLKVATGSGAGGGGTEEEEAVGTIVNWLMSKIG